MFEKLKKYLQKIKEVGKSIPREYNQPWPHFVFRCADCNGTRFFAIKHGDAKLKSVCCATVGCYSAYQVGIDGVAVRISNILYFSSKDPNFKLHDGTKPNRVPDRRSAIAAAKKSRNDRKKS